MAKKKPQATGDCATCPFWKMKNSKIKGKLVPGGPANAPGPRGCVRTPNPRTPSRGLRKKRKKKGAVPHTPPETTPQPPSNGSHEVHLSLIYPNPASPASFFRKEALEELALSIKEQGLIEPLVVVPRGGKFMLVAGERRWRACQMIGLETVPVRVLEADDRQVAEMALVENLQRQDLTPLEEARAFKTCWTRAIPKRSWPKSWASSRCGGWTSA
jgi:hypothetical protein